MIVLACGGRNYLARDTVAAYLKLYVPPDAVLIQGGARGADRLAKQWADSNGRHCATVEALWSMYGRGAGMRRNAAMLVFRPNLCVAFPGGSGTRDMVQLCTDAGIAVVLVP